MASSSGGGWLATDSGGTPNLDAGYTSDDLNRLIAADYGNGSGGSIANQTRREAWTLDQPGNAKNVKWDHNGDLDYSDAGEFQEDRTHNEVNELTKRELDTNNTAGYETTYSSITYDGNGNLTDDKAMFTYVYDAWNRLRKIKESGFVVAEFSYNGLNHRCRTKADVTDAFGGGSPDGVADSWDPDYFYCYDLNWRVLEVYRSTDANGKLQYVYNNAGLDGSGSASYIDSLMLWDADQNSGWPNQADSTKEKRWYALANQHHDLCVVLTDTGKMAEHTRYFGYGKVLALPAGDSDNNGTYDAADATEIGDADTYAVYQDADLDNDNDAADVTHASSITGGYQTLGVGVLSSTGVRSRKGYAGYEYLPELEGYAPFALARNRWYRADLGRWLSRDPIGHVDGPNLYSYAGAAPSSSVDSCGLTAVAIGIYDPTGTHLEWRQRTIATAFWNLQYRLNLWECQGSEDIYMVQKIIKSRRRDDRCENNLVLNEYIIFFEAAVMGKNTAPPPLIVRDDITVGFTPRKKGFEQELNSHEIKVFCRHEMTGNNPASSWKKQPLRWRNSPMDTGDATIYRGPDPSWWGGGTSSSHILWIEANRCINRPFQNTVRAQFGAAFPGGGYTSPISQLNL